MQMRKIIAMTTLAPVLAGCSLFGGTASPEELAGANKIIMDAVAKTVEADSAKAIMDFGMDLDIKGGMAGSIGIKVKSEGQGGIDAETGKFDISFELGGDLGKSVEEEGGPTAGSASVEMGRTGYDIYGKVTDLSVTPDKLMSFVDLFAPDLKGTWYYINMKELPGAAAASYDLEAMKNWTLRDMIVNTLIADGAMTKEEAGKIADVVIAAKYMKVTNATKEGDGTRYQVELDAAGLAESVLAIDSAAEVTPEKIAEMQAKMDKVLANKEVSVLVGSDGYIHGLTANIVIDDKEDVMGTGGQMGKMSFDLSVEISDFGATVSFEAPAESENLMEKMGALFSASAGMGGEPEETEFDLDQELDLGTEEVVTE